MRALAEHHSMLVSDRRLEAQRRAQAETWLSESVREEFGRTGLARATKLVEEEGGLSAGSPFRHMRDLHLALERGDPGSPSGGAKA
jgi:hypothetical protein